jgi:hypothetical protein
MSINPPPPPPTQPPTPPGGQPPQPPAGGQPPYGQPVYPDPAADAAAAKKKSRNILIGVCVAAVALIVGAYFFGQSQEKSKYDPGQPAYNAIYEKGAKTGAVAGTAQGTKTGKKEGLAQGTEAGKKSGLKQGQQQGQAQGVNEGQQQGATETLGGLTGWNTDTPYVVEFGPGPNSNIPYAVQTRTLMQTGTLYKICSSGQGICTEAPSSASTSSDSSGGSNTGPTG